MAPSYEEEEKHWTNEVKRQRGVLEMYPRGGTAMQKNAELARSITTQERFTHDASSNGYSLPRQAVDALLSHARQDAAWAALNTITIWEELRTIKRVVVVILVAVLGIVVKLFLYSPTP